MRCHYIWDKEAGKVLIPGCMAVAHSDDMRRCTCGNDTFASFQKERYNEILNEKQLRIKELEKEVFRLNRILRRVNGFKT